MLLALIRPLYCLIRWCVTGVNYCAEIQAIKFLMAGKGIGALIKKLFMSSASSAIREATMDESKNMLKVDMDGSSSYFAIALLILLVLVVMVTITICCGCSPSKMARRRQEEEWRDEIRGMMEKRNAGDAEVGLEAEGWSEINKGKTDLRLVEGS